MQRIFLFCFLLIAAAAAAQTPVTTTVPKRGPGKYYPDGHGHKIFVPLGDPSFADTVISYTVGDPAPIAAARDCTLAVGIPNFDGIAGGFLSLGCGGTVVLKFTNNALVNIPGNDLYVFELGKYVEKTNLAISKDGITWIEVGAISGGNCAVDIGSAVKPGETFRYVRLTDLKSDCTAMWPGADIDAVAALGSGRQYTLSSSVLFDVDKSIIKAAAKKDLDSLIKNINSFGASQIIIEGHTDSTGSVTHNNTLSQSRSKAVNDYFKAKLTDKTIDIRNYGYGEQYPVADNGTDAGKEKNRRVEIVVVPKDVGTTTTTAPAGTGTGTTPKPAGKGN